jgi:hypothetical protein
MILSAYLSHSIRGPYGDAATPEQIKAACDEAIRRASQIERDMAIDLYVPARHDEFVQAAYRQGSISERGILLADCAILARRDIVMAWDPSDKMVSKGMRIECEHALSIGKQVFIFRHWDRETWGRLEWFLLKQVPLSGQGPYALHPRDYTKVETY